MKKILLIFAQSLALIISTLILVTCKKYQHGETINLVYGESKEINHISVKEVFVKLNRKCDSIIYKPKISDNPATEFLKSIINRDVSKLDKYISKNVALASDYSSKREMYEDWKADDKESTFWDYLEGYFNLEGSYLNDSTYITPILSQVESDTLCSLEDKLFVLSRIYIYREPDKHSLKVGELSKNRVISFDSNRTIMPYSKYERMEYPSIEEFDTDIWYYLTDYDGYVNNEFVFNPFYSSTMYFKKEKSGRWILSEFTHFD